MINTITTSLSCNLPCRYPADQALTLLSFKKGASTLHHVATITTTYGANLRPQPSSNSSLSPPRLRRTHEMEGEMSLKDTLTLMTKGIVNRQQFESIFIYIIRILHMNYIGIIHPEQKGHRGISPSWLCCDVSSEHLAPAAPLQHWETGRRPNANADLLRSWKKMPSYPTHPQNQEPIWSTHEIKDMNLNETKSLVSSMSASQFLLINFSFGSEMKWSSDTSEKVYQAPSTPQNPLASINEEATATVEATAIGADQRVGPKAFVAFVVNHRKNVNSHLTWRRISREDVAIVKQALKKWCFHQLCLIMY